MPATPRRLPYANAQLIRLKLPQEEHSSGLNDVFVNPPALPPALSRCQRETIRSSKERRLRRWPVAGSRMPKASRWLRPTRAACAPGRESCALGGREGVRPHLLQRDSGALFGCGSRYVPRPLFPVGPEQRSLWQKRSRGSIYAHPLVDVRHQQGCRRTRLLFNSMAQPRFAGVLPALRAVANFRELT
jgi:hypothetical protein